MKLPNGSCRPVVSVVPGQEEPCVGEHPPGNHRVVGDDQEAGDGPCPADDVPQSGETEPLGNFPCRLHGTMPRPAADHDFGDEDGGAEHQASDHEYQDECESAPGARQIGEAPDTAETYGG